MKAVHIREFGGPEVLEWREGPDVRRPLAGEIVVRVHAAGVNRADLLQRQGLYPPPEGTSADIPGLEFAGEVADIGPEDASHAQPFRIGSRVFGITSGEAQAEYVVVPAGQAAAIPERLSFEEAAAVPEVFITAHDALFTQAGLTAGETVLIHAVGSGVGLAGAQLATAAGAKVIGTSRTREKLEAARASGVDGGIEVSDVRELSSRVKEIEPAGVDVILDLVGGAYFGENLRCLAAKGRLILVGLTAGRRAEFDLGIALTKRLRIIGTVLRSRTADEKAEAVAAFVRDVVPLLGSGEVVPNLDRVFPASEIGAAHEYLASNASFGKVVVTI